MKTAFVFHHLFTVLQTYLELRSMDPSNEFVHAKQECIPTISRRNSSFCIIPARINNTFSTVDAIVSPEDYDKLIKISAEWYVSSNGYVVHSRRVDKKYVRKYMHKEIMGSSATHINGDRLDNRRENLVLKNRKRVSDISLQDLELSSILPLECSTSEIPEQGKDVTILYDEKIYSGEVVSYLPHGFGVLTETQKTSLGWWHEGAFRKGLIMEHKPVPPRLRDACGFHSQMGPVKRAYIWWNNKVVYSTEI